MTTPLELAGRVFDSIQIEKLISDKGAQGHVWLGKDLPFNRHVAVKIFHWRKHDTQHDTYLNDWLNTAEMWGRAKGEYIIKPYRFFDKADNESDYHLMFFVMEYAIFSLREAIDEQRTPLDLETKVRWMLESAQGLAAAHRENITHRDVCPNNILIVEDPATNILRAKLSDFGLARPTPKGNSEHVVGQEPYAAPESRGKAYKLTSDTYALGMTYLHLMTGSFGKFRRLLRHEEKKFDRHLVAKISPELEQHSTCARILDLVQEMVTTRLSIEHVIERLRPIQQELPPKQLTGSTSKQNTPTSVPETSLCNRFVWHMNVHAHFHEKLYYFWLRGFLSVRSLRQIIPRFMPEPVNRAFCSYEVYGNDDVLLRVWLTPSLKDT